MRKFRSAGIRRFSIFAGLALLMGLVGASPVWGTVDTRSGDRVVISSDEEVGDDLYVFANEVVVDGTVRGDLVAFGSKITVNGTVEGDLIAAGRDVEIGGTVDDDSRIAGQTLLLRDSARIGDDLLAASYSLESEPDSTVGGTLLYAGYQALLAGTVDEDLKGALNGLELSGEVGRDVNVEVDGEDGGPPPFVFASGAQGQMAAVASGLTLTDSARVGGDLTYESSTEAQISPAAQISGDVFHEERPVEEEPTRTIVDEILDNLRSFIALVLVGLLLLWLVPNWTRRLADRVQARPLPSLGWGVAGFVGFIALAIAILLATILLAVILGLLTLGGLIGLIILLGILAELALVLAFWISTGYLAQIIVSFLGGRLLLERVRPNWAAGRVLPLIIGLILYVILRAIPILGPLVGLVVVLLGLGALSHRIWVTLRRRPDQPPPAGDVGP